MKKRIYTFSALLLAVVLLFACAGCGSQNVDGDYYYTGDGKYYLSDASADELSYEPAATEAVNKKSGQSTDGVTDSKLNIGETDPARKLVYTVNYQLETKDFDASVSTLLALVNEVGGYAQSTQVQGSVSNGGRNGSYTLRVPSGKLQDFIEKIGTVGSINSESLNTQDVTLEYVDVESKLKSLNTQEERLLAMLAKAENISEMLEIESSLANVRYEIESYTSRLNTLKSLVDYSTVEVTLTEVIEYTPQEIEPTTFGERLAQTFRESMARIGEFFQNFAVWFLGNFFEIVLVLALIAGGIWLIVAVIKGLTRRSRRKKNKSLSETPVQNTK